jgi:hypothetical protein
MKTEVVMKTQDRELFGVKVRQNTNGFLCLTDLQKAYDAKSVVENWPVNRVDKILGRESNHYRMYYLLKEQGLIDVDVDVFIEEMQRPSKALKKFKAYRVIGARENKSTWCNPYIWAMIAMEMNYLLYAKVAMWLTDKLLVNRIEAGNLCVDFNKSIAKWNPDYARMAKGLNYIVFGTHHNGIRNTATTKQLEELADLQMKLSFGIDMGYVKTEIDLYNDLVKMFHAKWPDYSKK